MRVVADTNIVISGLLWHGLPRLLLDKARTQELELFTSVILLAELEDVLRRRKLARRLMLAGVELKDLVLGYAALATVVQPDASPPVIADDPDDDAVLACAVAAHADAIVTGDSHLLDLGQYQRIPVLTVAQLLEHRTR
jgi:putative PIN family toxin of toxin-antitoxin system